MAGNITKMEMLIAKKPGVLQATHRCRGRSEAWGLTGDTDAEEGVKHGVLQATQIIVKQTSPSADQRHF